MPSKTYSEMLHELPFWTLSGIATPPLHWTACSSAWPPFEQRKFSSYPTQTFPGATWGHFILNYQQSPGRRDPTSLQPPSRLCREMQCNIAMVFILVFQPFHHCGDCCSKGLLPTLRGCLGNNWAKMLWPFFWTKLSKLTNFPPALKVLCDICWAAVVRLCFGEQTSLSTGARLFSLWKALLRDVIYFGS